MAKAGTINEVIDIKAVEAQFSTVDKYIDALVVKIEGLNKAAGNIKGAGNAQQQNAAQAAANKQAQEAVAITAKLTDEELKAAKAKQEKAYRTKLANDAAKDEINANKEIVGAYKALETEAKKATKAARDLAAQYGANSKEAKAATEAANKLNSELKQIDASINIHNKNVGNYGSALDKLKGNWMALTAGFAAASAAMSGVVAFFKGAIQGAMEDERAVRRLEFATNNNTKATERFLRLKDSLMETTLFQEDEIMGAINMGLEMGRTEAETRKMVETAMGLARVTGTDLNTQMLALSGTFEGQTGKLGKLSGDIKGLTETQLKNGEAVDILNAKYAKFASEGLNSTEGEVLQAKKWWGEFLDEVGAKTVVFLRRLWEATKVQALFLTGGVDKEANEEKRLENQRKRIKLIQDDIAAMRAGKTATQETTDKVKEQTAAVETAVSSLEEYERQLYKVNRMLASMGLGEEITRMTPKGTPSTVSGGAPGARKISQTPTKVSPDGGFPSEILSGADYEKYIQDQQRAEAEVWNQRLSIAADTLAKIDGLVNQSFANRFSKIDIEAQKDEEAKQKELKLAGDNATKKDEIERKYAAKEAEREKEKRRLQKEQAKYQKNAALIQSIVNTAVGVTGAVAATPGPVGIVMAALVLALGLAQTAMIASQPLPSYAKGRKGGKAELANINERGQEAVVTRSGDVYFPQGPLAYLPEGSSVIPHHELVDMAGRSATTRGLPDWTATDTNLSLRNEVNGLHRGFAMLAREIRDKKETHINITEKGIWAATSRGNVYEEWINQHIRL